MLTNSQRNSNSNESDVEQSDPTGDEH